MRPIKLTMTAFGPYRDVESIDFEQLGDRRLFVISGNTGAGKTSIFDAICYALYGTASGEDRADPRMLRSHFADEDTHTAVQFEFVVGRKRYSVFRQLAHRKGNNKGETGGKAELYELIHDEQIPLVDRFHVTEVNAKLEAIIGLTKEQFSQIVMLPQGEFRKLLTSDTDNKEQILRRIFRTELYEKLELRFQGMSRGLQDQLKEARASSSAYLKQAQDGLPQREGSVLSELFLQPSYTSSQVLEALGDELAYYESERLRATVRRTELTAAIGLQEAALRDGLAINGKHDEYDRKLQQHTGFAEQRAHYESLEKRLKLAERAAQLLPYEEQRARSEAELSAKKRERSERELKLTAAQEAASEAVKRYSEQSKRSEERVEAQHELRRLQELEPIVRTLAAQEERLQQLVKQEQTAGGKLGLAEQALLQCRERRNTQLAMIKKLEAETAALPDKLQKLDKIMQQGKTLTRLLDLEKELDRYRQEEEQHSQALLVIRQQHDALEQHWIEGQASLLAEHLHDGKPCPVCGSEVHPSKSIAAGEIPSREQLYEAKEKLSGIERQLMEAKAQTAVTLATRDKEASELGQNLLAILELEQQQAQLRAEWRKLKEESDTLQLQSKELMELKEKADKTEAELEQQQALKERLQLELQQLTVSRASQQAQLEKEYERIPNALHTPEQLSKRLQEQQRLSFGLEQAWLQAQEQQQVTAAALAEAKAYAEQTAESHAAAEQRLQEAFQRLQLERLKAGFEQEEQYAAAVMPEGQRSELQRQLNDYRTAVAALTEQLEELKRELEQKPRVDTAAIQQMLEHQKLELERAITEAQRSQSHKQEIERLSATISRVNIEMKELEKKLEELLDVYQMLKGDNALKISFERYILIEYLEQILQAANMRLRDLSNGQFELQRSDRLETRGKQSGLGLDIYDAYTGQYRDVKTMSGGEKFNASLCLALGMTDVIQSHQGGVSIEMMFIDEGFGTLDEEALNKAIAALVDLQRAGRMIGVISHVQELKDAFPACIEVHKTKAGYSRTSVTVK